MKKEEIVAQLELFGSSSKDLDKLSKKELENLLEQVTALQSANSDESEVTNIVNETPFVPPTPDSLEWTDYVLGLLSPDKEMDKGNPKTDGLRRIATKIFGDFSITTNVVEPPNINNSYRASVVVSLELKNGLRYDGAADVYSGNTDKKFAVHALATAETRAEGRALRKALRLTKVLAAEELLNADVDEPTGLESNSAMPTGMLSSLEVVANKHSIDLLRTAQFHKMNVNSTLELTQEQGKELMLILGKYGRKELEIPNEIRK